MKRIVKGDTPEFWATFLRKHPRVTYSQLNDVKGGAEARKNLHTCLTKEQGYLCCYCCCQLEGIESHNEHIKPKGKYSQDSMDYRNIVASCSNDRHCGQYKKDDYDDKLFVSPLEENCEEQFKFHDSGYITSATKRGDKTIETLGLNNMTLRQSRKSQYNGVYLTCKAQAASIWEKNGKNSKQAQVEYNEFFNTEIVRNYLSKDEGKYPAFVDMLEYFQKQGRFDYENLVNEFANAI